MTRTQKLIIKQLLEGASIGISGRQIRLRDPGGNPISKVRRSTFDWLRKWDLVRRHRHFFVINRRTVRSMHGNSAAKRLYKGKPVAGLLQNPPPPRNGKERPTQPTLF